MSGPPGGRKPAPSVLGLPPVPFRKLYTFASHGDVALVVVACVSGAISGAILPLFSIVFGASLNVLNNPTADIVALINQLSLYFLLIAIGAFIFTFLEGSLIVYTTEKQLFRLRSAYVRNLLRLDAGWYDVHRASEAVTRLADSSAVMGTGMEKLASLVRYCATLVTGLAVGFATSWKLTLVVIACAPLFAIALAVLITTAISSERRERVAYARAGSVATEVISLIRAVAAYGGEAHESSHYGKYLRMAETAGVRKGIFIGACVGFMLFSFYLFYGISTWAGAVFVQQSNDANPACIYAPNTAGCFSGGTVVTTFVAVLLGALSFGQIGPLIGNISAARAAAADLFGVIDAKPAAGDVYATDGYRGPLLAESGSTKTLADTAAVPAAASDVPTAAVPVALPAPASTAPAGLRIEYRDVVFAYPSRPDTLILNGFSLTLEPGERLGVVGASGSGKSTLALLALRVYDPQGGAVIVGGVDVRKWHLPSLREALGIVSQEPVLFSMSVHDNIALGAREGVPPPTREAVAAAAAAANAHTFITALPQGYDTLAGASVSASQLSGGQRQRVCIARALLRDPAALLLDEATSALDTTSERVVQAALDAVAAAGRRTMLIIAHRLSTVAACDRIVVMQAGAIVEQGAPAELAVRPGGIFRAMLAAQEVSDPGAAVDAAGGDNSEAAALAAASDNAPPSPPAWQPPAALSPSASLAVEPHTRINVPLSMPVPLPPDETADPAVETLAAGGSILSPERAPAAGLPSVSKVAPGAVSAAAAANAVVAAKPSLRSLRGRLWELQRDDLPWFVLGIFGSLAAGCIQPIVAIIYGNVIAIYYQPNMAQNALPYLGWFVLLGVCAFAGVLCRIGVFTLLGERLTFKLRAASFEAILRQPAAFFDRSENGVGRLTQRLATDAALVRGASGEALGSVFEACGAIICALAIAFSASWQLALVLCCAFPFLVLGTIVEFRQVTQSGGKSGPGAALLEDASQLISEAVAAVRSVLAYNLQARTATAYIAAVTGPRDVGYKRGLITGLGQGFQRFILMCTYSLAFWAGAQFISQGVLAFPSLIRTFLSITLAGEALGRISSQAPDAAKAEAAARAIFAIIDAGAASAIDSLSAAGSGRPAATVSGGLRVEFRNVTFAYPSRPDVPVLRDFSLAIEPGTAVGVVGASGSGKSTLAMLLMRFYDVDAGAVLVDGLDVREWNVRALRAEFGLVQQEPALFADSIAYNIQYGVRGAEKMVPSMGAQPKETGDASEVKKGAKNVAGGGDGGKVAASEADLKAGATAPSIDVEKAAVAPTAPAISYLPPSPEVIDAATAANAAGFISELADGYATYVGARGSQLSGGQRQRVAIARALLRAPAALLLDEATAALDSKSEEVVQAALDAVIEASRAQAAHAAGDASLPPARTTLVIAHRLSTLAKADRIVVLDKGRVAEDGTHAVLMAKPGGRYRTLALAQQAGAHI